MECVGDVGLHSGGVDMNAVRFTLADAAYIAHGMIHTRCAGCPAMIWRHVAYRPREVYCDTCAYLLREKFNYLNHERDTEEEEIDGEPS
jgi:hypothetical protein